MDDLLKGTDGKVSSMRVVFLSTTLISMFAWFIVSLKGWVLVDLPDNILYLIIALATGKVGQKGLEKTK